MCVCVCVCVCARVHAWNGMNEDSVLADMCMFEAVSMWLMETVPKRIPLLATVGRGTFCCHLHRTIYPVTMVNVGYHCGLSVIYHSLN